MCVEHLSPYIGEWGHSQLVGFALALQQGHGAAT